MTNRASTRVGLGVLLIALGTLLYEVCLTRILSVTLWYHFGFLAIAFAMLGSTAAAICCFVFRERLAGNAYESRLGWFALLFAVSAPAATFVHFHAPLDAFSVGGEKFFAVMGIQLLVLFVVFFASGLCVTIALTRFAASLSTVYFCDLVGAAAGSLLFVPLLSWFSAPALVFAASLAGGLASYLFFGQGTHRLCKCAAALSTAGFALLLSCNDEWGVLKVSRVKAYRGGPMQQQESGAIYEKWSPVARVAVFQPRLSSANRELMLVTNDGGAPTNLHQFDGDVANLQYLRRDARQIAHYLKPHADVLIIGSAGGRDVRAALAFDQRSITAVEINPVTVELVSSRYADYIGGIFQHPKVSLHQAEGRNFLTTTSRRFDLIQVTMVDSWAGSTAGAYVFNESNLYTTDAISDFAQRLKPDGILSITRYYACHEALRLANVMLSHLAQVGAADPHLRLAVAVDRKQEKSRATVLLKNGIFTPKDTQRLFEAAQASHSDLVYAPHANDGGLVQSEYARLFRALIDPQQHGLADHGLSSREEIVRKFPLDIRPVSDDRPFFFFMDRPRAALFWGGSGHVARRMALPLLYGMFGFLGLVCLLTVVAPLVLHRESSLRQMPCRWRAMVYFGCLGVGFMVIELGLIHRLTVLLGYPAYSFITVVTTLLLAAGLGSWLSGWKKVRGNRAFLCVVLVVVSLGVAGWAISFQQLNALRGLTANVRTVYVVALLAPLGFCMGMCFPLGMEILRKLHPAIVPWGWGVNGACSVFGCAVTLVIALNFGLTVCLLVGSGCYLAALACMLTIKSPTELLTQKTE